MPEIGICKTKDRKMAGRVELKGQIGTNKNMLPTRIVQDNGRKYMFFKMWSDNYAKARIEDNNGNKRYQRDAVQVVLPENAHGEKLFEILAGGRKVLVKGRLTHRPNIGTTKSGEQVAYANPVVYLETLEFLDEPPKSAAKRFLDVLQSECNVINDEQKDTMMAAFVKHHDSLRVEKDNTTPQMSDEPEDLEDIPFA